ncbi:unnamed protein product [Prorocentrum cordatum]|uniref:CRAL-TRIO domain-containing protein n=1 Tax=Prorocentrum cordatum TaxID=2364126 RepID=A0ABN9QZU0_9DINO|nr:unnamed protein product [Polarella glacialis]
MRLQTSTAPRETTRRRPTEAGAAPAGEAEAAPGLPSLGSALHLAGGCRPCAFAAQGACKSGALCRQRPLAAWRPGPRALAMDAPRVLELNLLLSACAHLARRAGEVMREVRAEGQLGAHNKKLEGDERDAQAMDPAEVLTIADTRSQDVIVSSLRDMFPGIRIVGEEDEASGGKEARTRLSEVPPLPRMEVPEAPRPPLIVDQEKARTSELIGMAADATCLTCPGRRRAAAAAGSQARAAETPRAAPAAAGGLPAEQRARLADFRALLGPGGAEADEQLLLRFLRARRWDLAAAKEQFEAAQRWRAESGADRLRRRASGPSGAEVARAAARDPRLSSGGVERFPEQRLVERHDKESVWRRLSPVAYFGHDREAIVDGFVRLQEVQAARMAEASALLGRPVTSQVIIMDLAGMAWKPHPRSLAVFLTLGMHFFVNTPWVFTAVWRALRPALDPTTVSKMHILGSDFRAELLRHIDPGQLPRELGGTNDFDVLWSPMGSSELEELLGRHRQEPTAAHPPETANDQPAHPAGTRFRAPEGWGVFQAIAKSFTYDDTCLWVDPLDGTIEVAHIGSSAARRVRRARAAAAADGAVRLARDLSAHRAERLRIAEEALGAIAGGDGNLANRAQPFAPTAGLHAQTEGIAPRCWDAPAAADRDGACRRAPGPPRGMTALAEGAAAVEAEVSIYINEWLVELQRWTASTASYAPLARSRGRFESILKRTAELERITRACNELAAAVLERVASVTWPRLAAAGVAAASVWIPAPPRAAPRGARIGQLRELWAGVSRDAASAQRPARAHAGATQPEPARWNLASTGAMDQDYDRFDLVVAKLMIPHIVPGVAQAQERHWGGAWADLFGHAWAELFARIGAQAHRLPAAPVDVFRVELSDAKAGAQLSARMPAAAGTRSEQAAAEVPRCARPPATPGPAQLVQARHQLSCRGAAGVCTKCTASASSEAALARLEHTQPVRPRAYGALVARARALRLGSERPRRAGPAGRRRASAHMGRGRPSAAERGAGAAAGASGSGRGGTVACGECGRVLPRSAFSRAALAADGGSCRDCQHHFCGGCNQWLPPSRFDAEALRHQRPARARWGAAPPGQACASWCASCGENAQVDRLLNTPKDEVTHFGAWGAVQLQREADHAFLLVCCRRGICERVVLEKILAFARVPFVMTSGGVHYCELCDEAFDEVTAARQYHMRVPSARAQWDGCPGPRLHFHVGQVCDTAALQRSDNGAWFFKTMARVRPPKPGGGEAAATVAAEGQSKFEVRWAPLAATAEALGPSPVVEHLASQRHCSNHRRVSSGEVRLVGRAAMELARRLEESRPAHL